MRPQSERLRAVPGYVELDEAERPNGPPPYEPPGQVDRPCCDCALHT